MERHVPADHLLRSIDRFVDLSEARRHLAPFYGETGRPSIRPELMVRMLLVDYCLVVRSERRLCEEHGIAVTLPKPMTSGAKAHGRSTKQDLRSIADEDVYICPAGERPFGTIKARMGATLFLKKRLRRGEPAVIGARDEPTHPARLFSVERLRL